MTDTEAIQRLTRLRDEGRIRSWTVCCDEDGIHSVVLHWTHRRVPTVRSARLLGEALAEAMGDES